MHSRRHTVAVQTTHMVDQPIADQPDITVRPDLTINRAAQPLLVVDAKWKRLTTGPQTADLYQVLAYGTTWAAGGRCVGLSRKKMACLGVSFYAYATAVDGLHMRAMGRASVPWFGAAAGTNSQRICAALIS